MKKLIFTLAGYLVISQSFSQKFEWAKQLGGSKLEQGITLHCDAAGFIYTGGELNNNNDSFDADPGPGVKILLNRGGTDSYLSKYDSHGNLIWAKSMGGPNEDYIKDITTDAALNVYAVGDFAGLCDFNSGSGTDTLRAPAQAGFVVKYDSAGNFIWVKGYQSNIYINEVSVLSDTSIILAGHFETPVIDIDPGPGVVTLTRKSSLWDIFVVKLDSKGNFVWAKQMAGPTANYLYGLNTDLKDNIIITGAFTDSMDADPGIGKHMLVVPNGKTAGFIISLNADGNFNFANQYNSNYSYGLNIITDSACNVYATGSTTGSFGLSHSGGDTMVTGIGEAAVVIKCDSTGNLIWFSILNPLTGSDYVYFNDMTIDALQRVYLCGEFYGTVDFDPGSGLDTMRTMVPKSDDGFILKLENDGSMIWKKHLQSGGSSPRTLPRAIIIDKDYDVYSLGHFRGSSNFDSETGPFNLNSKGDQDVFFLKFSQCIPQFYTNPVAACDSFVWNGSRYYTDTLTTFHLEKDVLGCDSFVRIRLSISQSPVKTVTQNMNTFTADAVGATYQWWNCSTNQVIPGETGQSFTANSPGSYAVIVTKNGCSDTSDCLVATFSGIRDFQTAEKKIIKIVDLMGRETRLIPNTPLIIIYSDGSRERAMKIED